jgi:hypothetical protein
MVILPRLNAYRLMVVAAALTICVTAMLACALAVLAGRSLPVAARHDLSAAQNTSLLMSGSVTASDDAQYSSLLPGQIRRALDGTPYTLYHAVWSDPLGFTGGSGPAGGTRSSADAGNPPLAEAAALDEVTAHATLVSGSWPGGSAGRVIQAALPASAAAQMHVTVGQTVTFKDRVSGDPVRFLITGLYRASQAAGAAAQYWRLDLIGLSGASNVGGFTTYGPLTVPRSAFSGTGGGLVQAQASWLAEPRITSMPQDRFSGIASNLNALSGSLASGITLPSLELASGLPSALSAVAANLDVARSLLAICAILLALLAGAVLLAVARLLHGQREEETAMLVARGATRAQLLGFAAAEAVPLCVIAAVGGGVAGIWLARALAETGPLPDAIADAAQAAAAAAAGAVAVMLVPVLSRVTPGAARVRRGRQLAISAASKAGVDLGLIALAVLACWQLRHYSAVSAGANGTFGVDPVVVLAPALALAAGTVAALRLLPLGGKAGDKLAARGRGLVTALASWQISRQPIRQGGAALLIVLAVASATLAFTQRQTWLRSGHDQAEFAAGADVRVQSVLPLTAAQSATLISRPGVEHAMPAAVFPFGSGSGQVIAIGAPKAAGVALLRADQATVPASTLFAKIRSTDQAPGVALPGRPSRVQLTARLGPAGLGLGQVQVSVCVEDADGVVYQLQPPPLPADGQEHTLSAAVTPGATGAIYPLRVIAITFGYTLPAAKPTTPATFSVTGLSGGPGTPGVPGSVLRRFTAAASSVGLSAALQGGEGVTKGATVPVVRGIDARNGAEAVTFASGRGQLEVGPGVPNGPLAGQLALTAISPDAIPVMPGIATQSYLSANNTAVGSTVQATIDGVPLNVRIVAAVTSFPTVTANNPNGTGALIVDLANLQNFLSARSLAAAPVTQWWLATAGHGVPPGLGAGLPGGTAIISATALANGLLDDPVSDVPQLALLGVAIAALLLASTGFCVSIAAGVRQRRAENALLAALGVVPRAAAGQLCLEKFMLSLPSAAAGLALGVFLAELVVPAITLSASATAPEPPVLIGFGWVPTLGTALLLAVVPVVVAALVTLRRPDPAADLRAAEAV